MVFLDSLGWTVERIKGRPVLNALRLLIHTRKIVRKWEAPKRDVEIEQLRSRLDSAENAMREVVSHLQHSQRGSTHWAGCPDVHPVCRAINMLVDALALESRDVETPDAGDALRRVLNDPEAMERVMDRAHHEPRTVASR